MPTNNHSIGVLIVLFWTSQTQAETTREPPTVASMIEAASLTLPHPRSWTLSCAFGGGGSGSQPFEPRSNSSLLMNRQRCDSALADKITCSEWRFKSRQTLLRSHVCATSAAATFTRYGVLRRGCDTSAYLMQAITTRAADTTLFPPTHVEHHLP